MDFKVGDWIYHPAHGSGMITAEQDSNFTIRFPELGEKRIVKSFIKEASTPPFPGFRFPEGKAPAKRASSAAKAAAPKAATPAIGKRAVTIVKPRSASTTLDPAIDRFLREFPQGFADPALNTHEREDLAATIEHAQEQLSASALDTALTAGSLAQVCETAQTLAAELPLMAKPELVRFNNSVKTPANQKAFITALRDVLHGNESERQRVQGYISTLEKIGCSVWPVVTYFQFLISEGATMLFKPTVAQPMANAVGVSLLYRAEPNWATYARHEEVVAAVEARLQAKGLQPRNRLDVQDFMFRVAETAK